MTDEQRELANLKELLLMKICGLEKLYEERFEAYQTSLSLQAKEYERRLNALNGEAERLRSMQMTYVTKELYELNHKELSNKINDNKDLLTRISGKSQGISAAWVVIVVIASLVVSVLAIVLK